MNVSRLQGCRCAFGPVGTFDVVRIFCSFPMVLHPHITFFDAPFVGHVYLFSPFLFTPNMLLFSFLFSSFRCILCDIHLSARVPQVVFVSLFSFFLLSILGVVLLLLTKLTSSFTLLFPFFLFIYFTCLRVSWQRRSRSHTKSQILSHLPVCAS
jgi:prepilin signal peptidase PulO-like enzyme (type II secretory pathway)